MGDIPILRNCGSKERGFEVENIRVHVRPVVLSREREALPSLGRPEDGRSEIPAAVVEPDARRRILIIEDSKLRLHQNVAADLRLRVQPSALVIVQAGAVKNLVTRSILILAVEGEALLQPVIEPENPGPSMQFTALERS